MYNLHRYIQFETIHTSDNKNGELKHTDYPSIDITVFLGVPMFDYGFLERE